MNRNFKENQKLRYKDSKEKPVRVKRLDVKTFKVKHQDELLNFLIVEAKFSRNNAKALLSHHLVSIDGAPVSQFNFKLFPNDEIIISKKPIKKKKRDDLPILYEDNEFVVINKPVGLLAVASDTEKSSTAYRMVMDYVQQKDKHNRIFVVHRIDRETSGVLMFCKNEKIAKALTDSWNDIITKRGYFAIIDGQLDVKEDVIINYLKKNKENFMYVVNKPDKETKRAVTEYKVIKENENYSLLDINLKTGRKNQIRVAFGNLGHYIIGEDKYGEPGNPLKRLCLHSYELSFAHPITGKLYDFKTTMPKEFLSLMNKKKETR